MAPREPARSWLPPYPPSLPHHIETLLSPLLPSFPPSLLPLLSSITFSRLICSTLSGASGTIDSRVSGSLVERGAIVSVLHVIEGMGGVEKLTEIVSNIHGGDATAREQARRERKRLRSEASEAEGEGEGEGKGKGGQEPQKKQQRYDVSWVKSERVRAGLADDADGSEEEEEDEDEYDPDRATELQKSLVKGETNGNHKRGRTYPNHLPPPPSLLTVPVGTIEREEDGLEIFKEEISGWGTA